MNLNLVLYSYNPVFSNEIFNYLALFIDQPKLTLLLKRIRIGFVTM
jgi:hypothetical protein